MPKRFLKRSVLRKLFGALFFDWYWNIGIIEGPIQIFRAAKTDIEVKWFPLSKPGISRADPFGVIRDGKKYIFF